MNSPARVPNLRQAPEILEGGKATAASDVFSFGCVLFEILTWRLPWKGVPPLQASCLRACMWLFCVGIGGITAQAAIAARADPQLLPFPSRSCAW